MTREEVIEYCELFNPEIDELLYLYRSDAARKKVLEEQRGRAYAESEEKTK